MMSEVPAARGAVYRPTEDAADCVLMPVASLRNVRCAPGMAAPDGSVTLPVRPALFWACRDRHETRSTHGTTKASRLRGTQIRCLRDAVSRCSANRFCDPLRFCGSWFVMARSPQSFVLLPAVRPAATLSLVMGRYIDFFAVRRSDCTFFRRVLCKCRLIFGNILFGKIPTAQGNACIAGSGSTQRGLDSNCPLFSGK